MASNFCARFPLRLSQAPATIKLSNTFRFADWDSTCLLISKMVENNWLGQKSKQGFYKKIDKGIIHSIDLETLEYKPMNKKRYSAFSLAKEKTYLRDRLHTIVRSDDIAGNFLWTVMSKSLLYAANNIGIIADDILSIDNALKWGFGWELGPFEVLDAIGLEYFVKRIKSEGNTVTPWISDMLSSGFTCMYVLLDGKKEYYSIDKKEIVLEEPLKEIGNHFIHIHLGEELNPKIKIKIKAEK